MVVVRGGGGGGGAKKKPKRGGERKEWSKNNDFKKERQAGSRVGALKRGRGGLEPPYKLWVLQS